MAGRTIPGLALLLVPIATAQTFTMTPPEIAAMYDGSADGDLSALWRPLGLSSSIAHYGGQEDSSHCHGSCLVELYPGLDKANDQVVLICTTQYNGPCRYLYFRRNLQNSTWKFLGSVDDGCSHGPLGMRFENRFWVVSLEDGYGTGIFSQLDLWLVETPKGWQPSFETPSQGHWAILSYRIARSWQVLPLAVESDPATFRPKRAEFEFRITFAIDPVGDLFDIARKAVYLPNGSGTQMHLDPKKSELTQRNIGEFFSTDTPDELPPDRFLKFAFAPLLAIAGGPDGPQKVWLRNYLAKDAPHNTPEKRRLLETLTRTSR